MVLWNMTIPEVALVVFCSLIIIVSLVCKFRTRRLQRLHLVSIVTLTAFVVAFEIQKKGALYYWTTITPIVSIMMTEAFVSLQNKVERLAS